MNKNFVTEQASVIIVPQKKAYKKDEQKMAISENSFLENKYEYFVSFL